MANSIVQGREMQEAIAEREGKYLTFALGAEEYGLEILKVREIIVCCLRRRSTSRASSTCGGR